MIFFSNKSRPYHFGLYPLERLQRDLNLKRNIDPSTQKIAYYNANLMPPPNSHGIAMPPNRKEAIAAAAILETPAEARERVSRGGPTPEHYIPTAPLTDAERAALSQR
jgi:hypothetical protein